MKNPFNHGSKPTVLVCVLCGLHENWINPFLAQDLVKMARDTRFDVEVEMVIDKRPIDYARNCCVAMARERKAKFLVMIDADQSFSPAPIGTPLDALSAGGTDKDVIAFPYMQSFRFDGGQQGSIPKSYNHSVPVAQQGEFITADTVVAGTGCMIISHRVWERVPGPWFVWQQKPGELREAETSEDFYFCRLVQRHGFKVWLYGRMLPHWKRCDVTLVGTMLSGK